MDLIDEIRNELFEQLNVKIRLETISELLESYCLGYRIEVYELPDYFDSVVSHIIANTRVFLVGCDGKRVFLL